MREGKFPSLRKMAKWKEQNNKACVCLCVSMSLCLCWGGEGILSILEDCFSNNERASGLEAHVVTLLEKNIRTESAADLATSNAKL